MQGYCAQKRGVALIVMISTLAVIFALGTALLSITNTDILRASREEVRATALYAAEAGVDALAISLWRTFLVQQEFTAIDGACNNASDVNPKTANTAAFENGSRYTAAVVSYRFVDSYTRDVTILSVGWQDCDSNAALDAGEQRRALRVTIRLSLSRSHVFDYTYFVNNYGWMQGFTASTLIVNGDCRANGDFDFSGGAPTVNGSVYACANDKLLPSAGGRVNISPVRWSNAYYNTQASTRARQGYNSQIHGEKGGAEFETWRDLIYDRDGSMIGGRPEGAIIGDIGGLRTYGGALLDTEPTKEVTMPDLRDIQHYVKLSNDYVDDREKFLDGTPNPDYGVGAYLKVYNSSRRKYETVSTNGVVSGSTALIGTATRPIQVHGPVTVLGDVVIKGVVQGQGTIYAARNVHIVGSVNYKSPPNFKGSSAAEIEAQNQKKDILGLAARGSIIMGDTSRFTYSAPLQYMCPPFTHPRYDDSGNLIPAFDAYERDETGKMRYQSTLGDSYIHSVSESVGQIEAVLYTNLLGGGNLGTGGGGVEFDGSIISRDEAMVLWSLPFRMNYDNRIRERKLSGKPLIDIDLPRSPLFAYLTWQET